MTTQAYILRCLSPLHVGSGDTNYGVIDNLVQREAHTGLPGINSSSLKGALREYFETRQQPDTASINRMFGAPIKKGPEQIQETTQAGELTFDLGFLLSLPVRSDLTPYLCATTPYLLNQLTERLQQFGATESQQVKSLFKPFEIFKREQPLQTPLVVDERLKDGPVLEEEDFKASLYPTSKGDQYEKIIGEPMVLMPQQHFAELARDLPVIARNQLNNGISNNLWYEEVVPREARFFTLVSGPKPLVDAFHDQVANRVIQLGGNASVGYGQTLFLPLDSLISNR